MSDIEPWPPPGPQILLALRVRLEGIATDLGIRYEHDQQFARSGRAVIYGWQTVLHPPGQPPLTVWYDALDDDIAIFQDRRRPWHRHVWLEWQASTATRPPSWTTWRPSCPASWPAAPSRDR